MGRKSSDALHTIVTASMGEFWREVHLATPCHCENEPTIHYFEMGVFLLSTLRLVKTSPLFLLPLAKFSERAACTKSSPCTPCELWSAASFIAHNRSWSRCSTCGPQNRLVAHAAPALSVQLSSLTYPCARLSGERRGECRFVPGVGPYCILDPATGAIGPCRRCCTEAHDPIEGGLVFVEGNCV